MGTPIAIRWRHAGHDCAEGAPDALDDERRRLSAVFENVPVGLVFVESDGRIVSSNPQAERILGPAIRLARVSRVSGTVSLFMRTEGSSTAAEHPLTQALTDGDIHRGEYLFRAPPGRAIWVEFTGAPIRDLQGAIRGAVVAIADIDGRKRAEEALIRSEKLAVVGRLAATISHEINNPLESVTNLLYLIHENTSDARAREHSRTAQEELARVSHIVTHTLRFNRQTNSATAREGFRPARLRAGDL